MSFFFQWNTRAHAPWTRKHSPWISWKPWGSLLSSGPGQSSGQSQNIWRHKLSHDVIYTPSPWISRALFGSLPPSGPAGAQVSLKIYDVMSSGMMSATTPSPWISWVLSGSLSPSGPGRSSGQFSKYMTIQAQTKRHLYTLTMDFMGAFRLLAAIWTVPELRSVSKYMTSQAQAWCTATTHSLWISWTPSGSSPPSGPGQSSGPSQNMTSRAQTWRTQYTLTMDFKGAFRLLATIRTRPELRSVSKYDVTSSDMTSSKNTFSMNFMHKRLQAPHCQPDKPGTLVRLTTWRHELRQTTSAVIPI